MAKVADFTAWKIFNYTLRQLIARIRKANGYNTDPLITNDWQKAEASDAKHVVYFDAFYDDSGDHSVGNEQISRNRTTLGLKMECWSEIETEQSRKTSMMLEQDLKNAFTFISAGMEAAVGKGCITRVGRCTYDQGLLGPEKMVGFILEATVMYPSGPTW